MLEKLWLAPWGWKDLNLFGWPLVAAIVVLLFVGKPWCWLAFVPLILLIWLVSFFRDPPRAIPADPQAIVAPADGKVVDITPLEHYDFIGGPAVRIGIFLSIFNVHINRAPLSGRVIETHYHPGEFLNATRPESAERNEYHVDRIRADRTASTAVRRAANLWHVGPANRVHSGTRTDGHTRREVWYDQTWLANGVDSSEPWRGGNRRESR